jgi:hypothetical protein
LILVPTGVQTLATQFWNYQQNLAYGQAAPFALLMIAIAAVPSYVLGRFFDRYPIRGTSFWRRRSSRVLSMNRDVSPVSPRARRSPDVRGRR